MAIAGCVKWREHSLVEPSTTKKGCGVRMCEIAL